MLAVDKSSHGECAFDSTAVAGMHKYFRARVAYFGKCELLSRQKSRMSALGVSGVSDRLNSQLVLPPFTVTVSLHRLHFTVL